MLADVLEAVVDTCPVLCEIYCPHGHPMSLLWQKLGKKCPLLTLLYLHGHVVDAPYVVEFVQLQPSLLPNLTDVRLYGIRTPTIPDMRRNGGILNLSLPEYNFKATHEWICLPPKLRHLMCACFEAGPPTALADGTSTLSCLLSFTVGYNGDPVVIPLPLLVEILQAAPVVQVFKTERSCNSTVYAECKLDSNTSTYLSILKGREGTNLRNSACLTFSDDEGDDNVAIVHSLPIMTGFIHSKIEYCRSAHLSLLFATLPDVQILHLTGAANLNDIELRVAVGGHLQTLLLFACDSITPMGVYALCQRLVMLHSVSFDNCDELGEDAIQKCWQLLMAHGRVI